MSYKIQWTNQPIAKRRTKFPRLIPPLMDQSPRVISIVRSSTNQINRWSSRVKRSLGVQVRSWHSRCAFLVAVKPRKGALFKLGSNLFDKWFLFRLSSEISESTSKQVILQEKHQQEAHKRPHISPSNTWHNPCHRLLQHKAL